MTSDQTHDNVTEMMLDQWAKHRAEEPPDPYEDVDIHDEYLIRRRDEWERGNSSWSLLIGTRLAHQAIDDYEKRGK